MNTQTTTQKKFIPAPTFKYIEIIERSNNRVVKRMNVSNMPDATIAKTESGMSANLNAALYFTKSYADNKKLPVVGA